MMVMMKDSMKWNSRKLIGPKQFQLMELRVKRARALIWRGRKCGDEFGQTEYR